MVSGWLLQNNQKGLIANIEQGILNNEIGTALHYSVFLVFYSIFFSEQNTRKQEHIEIPLFFHL